MTAPMIDRPSRVDADTTRADIEEALAHLVATLRRLPSHYADKRADLHAEVDALLTDWQAAGA